jgi:hypothetical protein
MKELKQTIGEYTPEGATSDQTLLRITDQPQGSSCWIKIPKYFLMFILGSLMFTFAIVEIIFSTKRFTGSLSLLGDGIHNLIDVITMVIAFWADYVMKIFLNFLRVPKREIQRDILMECKEQSS